MESKGEDEKDICIPFFKGFLENDAKDVRKFKKSIYGLIQSPLKQNSIHYSVISTLGFIVNISRWRTHSTTSYKMLKKFDCKKECMIYQEKKFGRKKVMGQIECIKNAFIYTKNL